MSETDNAQFTCPESTLDSAIKRNLAQNVEQPTRRSRNEAEKNLVCESTYASGNSRRGFLAKAALITAGVVVGGALLGDKIIPASEAGAGSDLILGQTNCSGCSSTSLKAKTCKSTFTFNVSNSCPHGNAVKGTTCFGIGVEGEAYGCGTGVSGISSSGLGVYAQSTYYCAVGGVSVCGVGVSGASGYCYGVSGQSCYSAGVVGKASNRRTCLQPCCPNTSPGVCGSAVCGPGVCGSSTNGYGVRGYAGSKNATPLVARGHACQLSPLQEWQNGCGSALVAMNSAGILCFGKSNGNKIFLVNGCCNKFGFGIGTSQLEIYHGARYSCNHTSFGNSNGTAFTEFMRLTNQGNLGIGTTAPTAKLDAVSNGPSSVPMIAQGASGQTAPLQEWQNSSGSALAAINSAGRLCFGASLGDKIFLYDGCSNKFGLSIASSQLSVYHGASGACNHTSFGNYNGKCFTEFMRLTNQGNLGIGTTTPTYPLHLAPGKALRIEGGKCASDSANYFSFGGSGTFGIDGPGTSNGRFVVTNDGHVGIGASSPSCAKLVVCSSTSGGISAFSSAKCGIGVYGNGVSQGVFGLSSSTGVLGSGCESGVSGCSAGGVGVAGGSATGAGVSGVSTSGTGVLAESNGASGIPLVAKGSSSQSAPLQEWMNSSDKVLGVVNKCGWLGLGATSAPTTLHVGGSVSAKVETETGSTSVGSYPMKNSDFAVLVNATTIPSTDTSFTVTLPAASTTAGMIVFVKKTDASANPVSVVGHTNTSTKVQDTIEGSTTKSLKAQYDSLQLISNGSEWFVLGAGHACGSFVP